MKRKSEAFERGRILDKLAEILNGYVEKRHGELKKLSDEIWNFAEVGFHEYKSSRALEDFLSAEGFAVQTGVAGIPTAFVASYGKGRPSIGFLGEYDALYDLSQQASCTSRKTCPDKAAGHGCGHNLLGAGSLAAAVAVKDYLENFGLPGSVVYFGCPAEEDGSGKMFMVKDGLFDNMDGVFTWHPSDKNAVDGYSSLACIGVIYRFKGRSTHAAASPHLGRSALDACELTNIGANYLREHMPPEARIHYAYRDCGGAAPNVVQDHAAVYYFVRAPKVSQAVELRERVDNCARGAALMTGTSLEIITTDGLCDFVPNKTLSALLQRGMEEFGAPLFTPDDVNLAKEFQDGLPCGELAEKYDSFRRTYGDDIAQKIEGKALMDVILPLRFDPSASPGSTDVGDVSYACPTAQLNTACYAIGTPGHSWQLTAQSGSTIGLAGMLAAAKVLAYAAVKAIESPDTLNKARDEYEKSTGGKYICPVPVDTKPFLNGLE